MHLKIGDRVAVVDDNLEGAVSEINGNQITFISDNGFDYVYAEEDLVKLSGILSQSMQRINPKSKEETKKKLVKKPVSRLPVYDLHIEKIMQRHKHLRAGDKLEIQLAELNIILRHTQRKNIREFILVHGVGKGVLRVKIIKVLQTQKKLEYFDAPYHRFGQGAIQLRWL